MPDGTAPVLRRRQHISMTVHPQTLDRLDALCSRFALPRGQVLDKLVVALATAIDTGTLTCITGEACRIGRKDLPAVL